jgi:hypothetical protein
MVQFLFGKGADPSLLFFQLEKLHVQCTNGTVECRPGQSVFWFSQGCTPGCDECDHNGTRMPNWDHCAATRKDPFQPTLADEYRSANVSDPLHFFTNCFLSSHPL